ncbi:MAG: Efflux ABC transporter, permease protein [candidate division WWE3 bacterium GW2011_GWA1_41_8]|uniref:Efflux ABC transporter, permease protein n=2 Tax=Katanobacteria TaxID=422282 RepID=A0A0G1A7Q4_UNCKA|nr:MAG: Efflux ABC transporter, permease protein [candidate division WWE3 bacterium GW2011_GWA1_41_8]
MKLLDISNSAIKSLNVNRARSALTILGVVIGVFSVVTLVSIGRGMQNYIQDQFNALGSNLLFVSPGKADFQDDPSKALGRNKLDEKHVELIESNASELFITVSPYVVLGDNVRYKTKSFYGTVNGISYDDEKTYNYELDKGRFFTKSEQNTSARVAIIGPSIVEELFGTKNPVGNSIKLGDDSYQVIGSFKEKGRNFDDGVIVPYTSAMNTFDVPFFSSIVAKVRNTENVDLATREIKIALLKDLKEEDFTVLSQSDILSSIQNILQILTIGIGAIAGISLLVGGIGIMNIMLVSVTERIKEIGLRKALGATQLDIAMQFLIESVFLSLGGGLIGLLLGWLGTYASRTFLRTEIPWWAVALAFGFSVLVGVIFGTYPAITAAKKDPVEALRYE